MFVSVLLIATMLFAVSLLSYFLWVFFLDQSCHRVVRILCVIGSVLLMMPMTVLMFGLGIYGGTCILLSFPILLSAVLIGNYAKKKLEVWRSKV